MLAKQQLCTCITLFCTFRSCPCKSATWNVLMSHTCFMELVNTAQKFSISFSKLRYSSFGFDQPQTILPRFYKWNEHETELDRWSLKQCKFTFYVTFSVCCHPEILLQWQCNVTTSPHYCQIIEQLTEKTRGRSWVVLVLHEEGIGELMAKNIARTPRRQLSRWYLLFGEYLQNWKTLIISKTCW